MAAIDDLINKIDNPELKLQIQYVVRKLLKQKKFGIVFEDHLPESTILYGRRISVGHKVTYKNAPLKECFLVKKINGESAVCVSLADSQIVDIPTVDLVAYATFGEPIYPFLEYQDSIYNAPDSDLWHTLIQADNYHALQLLAYLYPGKVDCIYIDPPYNTGARDWKYNNDYVDSNDAYRHSKWLSMMKKRLLLAKKLLNPQKSAIIITIDEKEYNHLGCLIEDVFSNAKFQMISTVINPTGTQRPDSLNRTDEYIYVIRLGDMPIIPIIESRKPKVVDWRTFRRQGSDNLRPTRPNQFYPIYVDITTKTIVEIGEPITPDIDRFTVPQKDGCVAVFPIKDDGTEMMWSTEPDETRRRLSKGYIRVGKYQPDKPQQFILQYLYSGKIADIESGKATIIGHNEDGSVMAVYNDGKESMPTTQWNFPSHNAQTQGSSLLKKVIGEGRFSFPKSLYAVHDVLRYLVGDNKEALIVDFFAGSGTTLHAVNLLNAEDDGNRRCIMVTNNEVSEEEERILKSNGFFPGDDEWEKLGIARFVNWPRTVSSISGKDVFGNPINGDYLTYRTVEKKSNRKFQKVSFIKDIQALTLSERRDIISMLSDGAIAKNKITADTQYIVDDDIDITVLFDDSAAADWLDELEGQEHIKTFIICTQKNQLFTRLKTDITAKLGQYSVSVPMKFPMADGFKANAIFFKLGFLDKASVQLGRQFAELLPLLWMKAGAYGKCPTLGDNSIPDMLVLPENKFAVLTDENSFGQFENLLSKHSQIQTVFIVTDSEVGYREMIAELNVTNTYQLYRDYLDNFSINTKSSI